MGTENPSLDALNALPYLDKVVREVMRVHAPVVFTNRMATQDDIIPFGTPYTDTLGVKHESIACVVSLDYLYTSGLHSLPQHHQRPVRVDSHRGR